MEITFTKEDIELVEKLIRIKNSGFYASGEEVTKIYNRILNKNVNVTNCGSCIRGRIQELENALNHFKAISEKVEVNDTPDENKASESLENGSEEPKKKVGRPSKKQ